MLLNLHIGSIRFSLEGYRELLNDVPGYEFLAELLAALSHCQ